VNPYLTSLPSFGVIEVSGEDASAFLQGQFTSNLADIGDQGHQFSAWCNAQGRVICTLLVIRDNHRYLLVLPDTLIENVCQRLKMFVLRSRVVITDQRSRYRCAGLGDMADMNYTAPGVIRVAVAGTESGRHLLIATTDDLDSFRRDTNLPVTPDIQDHWQLADITGGITWIYSQTSGEILPQELDLEPLGALSYNKGCYPGQEIIARLHFRGRVKRRLCQGQITSDTTTPAPGVIVINQSSGQTVGHVLYSARASANEVRLLCVIDLELAADNTLKLDSGEPLHYTPHRTLADAR
jgi:tRNA-modifying protein YgfZ